jgi:hypothetical protein
MLRLKGIMSHTSILNYIDEREQIIVDLWSGGLNHFSANLPSQTITIACC